MTKKYNKFDKAAARIGASTFGNIAGSAAGTALGVTAVATEYATIVAAVAVGLPLVPAATGGLIIAAGAGICGTIAGMAAGKISDEITHDSDDEKEEPFYETGVNFVTNTIGSGLVAEYIERSEHNATEKFITGVTKRCVGNATEKIAKESFKSAANSGCNIM